MAAAGIASRAQQGQRAGEAGGVHEEETDRGKDDQDAGSAGTRHPGA